MAKKKRNANKPLIFTGLAIYGAMLLLFGWQTWGFVNWLFPDDQIGAKVLTLISFDVLALFWSLVHTFYSFKSPGALWWIRIAWGLTFTLSLVASVLYLVIQFFFRFHLVVDPNAVYVGYAVSIVALVMNILALMSWLILEYIARNPRQHEFDEDEDEEIPVPPQRLSPNYSRVLPASTPVPMPAFENPDKLLNLIDTGVRFGQLTEEEARPLRQALRSNPTSQSQNGSK